MRITYRDGAGACLIIQRETAAHLGPASLGPGYRRRVPIENLLEVLRSAQ